MGVVSIPRRAGVVRSMRTPTGAARQALEGGAEAEVRGRGFFIGIDCEQHELADEIAADFEPLLAKWNDLVVDVDSADALNQVIWDQVISKVDPATYAQ